MLQTNGGEVDFEDWYGEEHGALVRALILAAPSRSSHDAVDDLSVPDDELWSAVRSLPERQRLAIALRYVADLTEAEVAEAMGVRPGTVAATLSKARTQLATQLQPSIEVTAWQI